MGKGFTLAEVLITLVVIGVMAAMTIPTLMNQTNEQETITALKKAYSIMGQAYQKVISENGEIIPSELGSNEREATQKFGEMMAKHLSISKNCGMSTNEDCFAEGTYNFLNGTILGNFNNLDDYYKVRLNDGMSLLTNASNNYISVYQGFCDKMDYIFGHVSVDINGDKGPNVLGKDYFNFYVTKYGILPVGTPEDGVNTLSQCRTWGQGCTAWAISKGNMHYLRKDVSW